jgi:hypothetical protein
VTTDETRTGLPAGARGTLSASTPSPDHARFLPGGMVAGRYRVVGLLGRGGMGEVYRADDLKLGRPVALKFLPESVEESPHRLQRFLNEVRLALRITHSSVCRVHDIGEVDGQHYISMEYVDGEDLASLLRRIGRPPSTRGQSASFLICLLISIALFWFVLFRFGLLPVILGATVTNLLVILPLTFDLTAWYGYVTLLTLFVVAGVAVWGFWNALAGRPLFRDEILAAEAGAR